MSEKKAFVYKRPVTENNYDVFPVIPMSDWVIIERIPVVDNQTKMAKKSNLLVVGASSAKNVMELEKERQKDTMTYEDAEKKFIETWSEHPYQGIVMAIGNGRHLSEDSKIPLEIKPSDHVMYRARTGEPVVVDGKMFWMIKEHDIYAKYREGTI